jgi:hypothetical protein
MTLNASPVGFKRKPLQLGLNWMKSMATLGTNATPEAQALADQYWQQYGSTAMAQLGC